MQLVFVLSCFALCIAVRGQSKCKAPTATFTEDATWLTSKSETVPPKGVTFPSRNIGKAFKADPSTAGLLASKRSKGSQSVPSVKSCPSRKCPFRFDYIWKIGSCWIVKPIPVFPFLAHRPLPYARCETRKCKVTPWLTGRCRPAYLWTYRYVLVACQNGNDWHFKWIPGPTLPQCCHCRYSC